jgi:hypothetical protein
MATKIDSKSKHERAVPKTGEPSRDNNSMKDLLARMDERWSHIPESERARIPDDGAKNLDHYLYGAPNVSE